jgi:hypothetical protein
MNTKSASLLPWFEALKFSLRVMRKSFFKLFIPSMALSFLFGALNALIAFDAWFYFTHFPIAFLFNVLFICVISLPIYAFLYPILKRYVLFHGLQELSLIHLNEYKQLPWKIRIEYFLKLLKISLKRYSFQTLSFLLLMLPIILELLFERRNVGMGIIILDIVLISIIALLPVTWSYFAYFFAELHVINEISQEVKPVCIRSRKLIRPDKKLFWPILSWKALMFVLYFVLLFALGQLYILVGKVFYFDIYFSRFDLAMLYDLSPVLLFGFLFQPFFVHALNAILDYSGSNLFLENPNALWIMLFFLLLFGLLTAFFFLVETLSLVYFLHSAQRKMENSSLSGVDPEEA